MKNIALITASLVLASSGAYAQSANIDTSPEVSLTAGQYTQIAANDTTEVPGGVEADVNANGKINTDDAEQDAKETKEEVDQQSESELDSVNDAAKRKHESLEDGVDVDADADADAAIKH